MGLISAKSYVGPQRLKGMPSLAAKQLTHFVNRGSGACQFLSGRLRTDTERRKGGDQQYLHTGTLRESAPKTLDLGSGCFP